MATKKRKVRDEADARACLAAITVSGLSMKAWVNANGVDGRSLQSWLMTLQRRESTALRLVELVDDRVEKPVARYVVRVGDLAVEVDDHFDDHTLGRLLAVVAAC